MIFSAALFFCLLPLSYHDLTSRRLPNRWVAGVAALGCLRCLLAAASAGSLAPFAQATLGVVYAVGPAALIAGIYGALRRRGGLGMGDLKLLAALGLFFGPRAFWILPLASCLCVASLPVLMLWRKKKGQSSGLSATLPFGPYIALAALVAMACSLPA
ncbi:MAG: A24 family peptidase [Coriobacteriia bacterium]|nr:A24 family peptidase [Coriobacteriia bacterium]